ncbi:MAG: hypothetical protein AMXMBFR7_32160 [Planctomycetota bacterium]
MPSYPNALAFWHIVSKLKSAHCPVNSVTGLGMNPFLLRAAPRRAAHKQSLTASRRAAGNPLEFKSRQRTAYAGGPSRQRT